MWVDISKLGLEMLRVFKFGHAVSDPNYAKHLAADLLSTAAFGPIAGPGVNYVIGRIMGREDISLGGTIGLMAAGPAPGMVVSLVNFTVYDLPGHIDDIHQADFPVLGQDMSTLPSRFLTGVIPLALYGALGELQQMFVAPFQRQIPLKFGFTLNTPWTLPPVYYVVGVPGMSQDFQADAQFSGTPVWPGSPFRSHTTGILDYGVRHNWWGAVAADELVHPGRVARILEEALPSQSQNVWPLPSGPPFGGTLGRIDASDGIVFRGVHKRRRRF